MAREGVLGAALPSMLGFLPNVSVGVDRTYPGKKFDPPTVGCESEWEAFSSLNRVLHLNVFLEATKHADARASSCSTIPRW